MKANMTEIVFILDRSGSMQDLAGDTIGGYNAFLKAQKKAKGEARVTTVLFDDQYEVLHNGVIIGEVKPITAKEYFARGMTALLDAVGKTLVGTDIRLAAMAEDERPSKVIFVITTDGLENASKEFSHNIIKQMISHHREKLNWEFIFLGANIDAEATAESIGIRRDRASGYKASAAGTSVLYAEMARNVSNFRESGTMEDDWNNKIEGAKK